MFLLVEIRAIAPCSAFVTRIVQVRAAEINIGTFSPSVFVFLGSSSSSLLPLHPVGAKYNCCSAQPRQPRKTRSSVAPEFTRKESFMLIATANCPKVEGNWFHRLHS